VTTTWPEVPFNEVFVDVSAGQPKTLARDFCQAGRYPLVDQGRDLIGGYTDDPSRLSTAQLPLIIFGDHTRVIKYIDFPFGVGADGVKLLRPRRDSYVPYLFRFLQAVRIPPGGYDRHFKYLRRIMVPLPPIEHQRRLAAILDQCEGLRARRGAALALLDTFAESVFLSMFGHPAANTYLPTVQLGDLGKWQSGGTPPRSRKHYFGGDIPWFSSGDLDAVYAQGNVETITEEALHETSAKAVPPGALMLGMYDSAALKSSIATQLCSCNQAVAFATLDPSLVSTRFVYTAIQVGRNFYLQQRRGIRQKNLNLSMIASLTIPLPPLHAQKEFEYRVVNADGCRSLLAASLQSRAFAGQL
jgi:type I restriction enzyme, S subunit